MTISLNKHSPTEFTFAKILRASGIEPGSLESILLANLDDLNLGDVTTEGLITAVAEVLHDKQEHNFMDRGWILKQSAVMIAEQMLLRAREDDVAQGSQLAVGSLEEFCQLSAENLQRARREPTEVN